MKRLPSIALFAALSALSLLSGRLLAGDVPANAIAHWDTSSSSLAEDILIIRDTIGDNDIVCPPEVAAKIKIDTEVPGGKALFFDGSQTKPAASKKKFELASDEVFVHARIRPTPGDTDGTALYCFGSFELRYMSKPNEIRLFVWSGPGAATSVKMHVDADQWSEVSASVQGATMELTVNGQTVTGILPEGTNMVIPKGVLWIGHGDKRPFIGGIADITIAPSKE